MIILLRCQTRHPGAEDQTVSSSVLGKEFGDGIAEAGYNVQTVQHISSAKARHRIVRARTPYIHAAGLGPHHPHEPHTCGKPEARFRRHLRAVLVGRGYLSNQIGRQAPIAIVLWAVPRRYTLRPDEGDTTSGARTVSGCPASLTRKPVSLARTLPSRCCFTNTRKAALSSATISPCSPLDQFVPARLIRHMGEIISSHRRHTQDGLAPRGRSSHASSRSPPRCDSGTLRTSCSC
jgi:hypothetical protein